MLESDKCHGENDKNGALMGIRNSMCVSIILNIVF